MILFPFLRRELPEESFIAKYFQAQGEPAIYEEPRADSNPADLRASVQNDPGVVAKRAQETRLKAIADEKALDGSGPYNYGDLSISTDDGLDDGLAKTSNFKIAIWLILGGAALWGGSELLVTGAVDLASMLGISERVIAVTMIAVGTSVPELAASVIAALKKEKAISLGKLIGSNIFNGLCVLAIPGLFQSDQMSFGWEYSEWSSLLQILFAITTIFCIYIFLLSKEKRKASLLLSIIFLSIYFISLFYAY